VPGTTGSSGVTRLRASHDAPGVVLTADLSSHDPPPYRGHIDVIDPTRGVQGWAVNLAAPRNPPQLALLVGSETVAHVTPNRQRDDISDAMSQLVTAGFLFDTETLSRAAAMAASPEDIITVRIAETLFELGTGGPAVRAADLRPTRSLAAATHAPGAAHGAETSVDRLLVIPGFGCMAEGWVLSPQRPVISFRLTIGGVTLTARPDALYRKPRADLLDAYQDAAHLVGEAGFVALFTGDTNPRDAAAPTLHIVFAGGAEASFALPARLPRLLGHTATAADALLFFPALAAESFFPRFAAAAIEADRAAQAPPVPLTLAKTPRIFVQVLPENRNDLFLAFETIATACRENLIDGLAFVAATDTTRAEAPWLLRDLRASHDLPASLFAIAGTDQAFALLPDIIRATGAKRFVFAAAGLFPTLQAHRLAAAYLRGTAKTPIFLGTEPDPFAPPDLHAFPSSRCFGWTGDAFLRWCETAPAFLGGHYRDNLLARATRAPTLCPNTVMVSGPLTPSPIELAVNETIYAAAS